MKKILLFASLAASIFLTSCENNPTDALVPVQNHILKATINGSAVTFDHTNVIKEDVTQDGLSYTDLVVKTNRKNDNSKQIIFRLEHMTPGPESCYYFLYKNGDQELDIETNNSFSVNVTQNTSNNIKGDFSGTLSDFEGNTVTITNGKFDISF